MATRFEKKNVSAIYLLKYYPHGLTFGCRAIPFIRRSNGMYVYVRVCSCMFTFRRNALPHFSDLHSEDIGGMFMIIFGARRQEQTLKM